MKIDIEPGVYRIRYVGVLQKDNTTFVDYEDSLIYDSDDLVKAKASIINRYKRHGYEFKSISYTKITAEKSQLLGEN